MARDVFLSHASADGETAEDLCPMLENSGVSCWIALRDIRPAARYGKERLFASERTTCS
jgi:hypothetical protein